MSIVLTPPILFPDNWLICPTCVISLPFSFAPYLISLRSQSCASSSSNVYCAWGPVQPCWSVFPYGLVFVCLFIYLFKIVLNKALFLLQLGPCSHPLHPPWQPLEGLAPSSTLSSPLYQQILQFKTLSSLRQWGTDVSRFAWSSVVQHRGWGSMMRPSRTSSIVPLMKGGGGTGGEWGDWTTWCLGDLWSSWHVPQLRWLMCLRWRPTKLQHPALGDGGGTGGSPLQSRSPQSLPRSPLQSGSPQSLLRSPLQSGIPQSLPRSPLQSGSPEPAPEPAPVREPTESAPEPAPVRECTESAPEPAPVREPTESAPEPAPVREPTESAPEPAPVRECTESAPEPAPVREPTESAPEPAPVRSPQSPLRSPQFLYEPQFRKPLHTVMFNTRYYINNKCNIFSISMIYYINMEQNYPI